MKVRLTLVPVVAAVALGLAVPASAVTTPNARPAVYGGTPAHGTPTSVSIAVFDGTQWPIGCSGAMWRPRLIITAAHCMTIEDSDQGVAGFALFAPGATALTYSDAGPQGAADVHVINTWRGGPYANVSSKVQPNDFAVLQLDADLGPSGFTRLATHLDMARWLASDSAVQHTGYGLTSVDDYPSEPFTTTLQLDQYDPTNSLGPVFSTSQSPSSGICPGDSGSPAYVNEGGGAVLMGEMAGGNAPCGGVTTYGNVGFLAMGYLDTLNTSLAAAGYPTIPSAPTEISLSGRNRSVLVTWTPPTTSPETVVGYDVLSADGTVVCQSATTSCEVPNLDDGAYAFTVRARNAEGEGDAMPVSATPVTIGPPTRLRAPKATATATGKVTVRFATTGASTSAVVREYRVRDSKGRLFCAVRPNPAASPKRTLSCSAVVKKAGSYRFTVVARTDMGVTPVSPRSRAVTIR